MTREQSDNNPKCEICGAALSGDLAESRYCMDCHDEPAKILKFLQKLAETAHKEPNISGYRNIKKLGRGSAGPVWLVEEEKTGRQMVLRLPNPEAAKNRYVRDGFSLESYISGHLNHKNIVREYGYAQSEDTCYRCVEFCDGISVDALIEENGGNLSVDLAASIILQVLDGFAHAHETPLPFNHKQGMGIMANEIVHLDFRPGKILFAGKDDNFTVKISGFGHVIAERIACISEDPSDGYLMTMSEFMPKQRIVNGFRYANPAADVWAAAACFYYMLTGSFVKDMGPPKNLIKIALTTDAIPIRKRNTAIPKKLAEVIDHALIERPNIGVQSAAELKKMIEGAL